MEIPDLIAMLNNLSQSLLSVQKLVTGFAYVLGLIFIFSGLLKYKKVGESGGHSKESYFVPTAYLGMGVALVFLPTLISGVSNTTFGVGNILSYSPYSTQSVQYSITVLVKTAGLIWFLRGCVLLTHASEPGVQHGPKGLMFLFSGILAINLENTEKFVTWLVNLFITWTSVAPSNPS